MRLIQRSRNYRGEAVESDLISGELIQTDSIWIDPGAHRPIIIPLGLTDDEFAELVIRIERKEAKALIAVLTEKLRELGD